MAPAQDPSRPEARQRITDAAFRLFANKGYSSTSIQDIADAATVKKAIVYYYFGSKEGLYQSLLSEGSANLKAFMNHAFSRVCAGDFTAVLNDEQFVPEVSNFLKAQRERAEKSPPPTFDLGLLLSADLPCEAKMAAVCETLISLGRQNREPLRFFFVHFCAPDSDRPAAPSGEESGLLPRQILEQIAQHCRLRGEIDGEPEDLSRLVLGAVHLSILGFLRDAEKEPLPPGLGLRIVRAALRGFLARDKAQKAASPAAHESTPPSTEGTPEPRPRRVALRARQPVGAGRRS